MGETLELLMAMAQYCAVPGHQLCCSGQFPRKGAVMGEGVEAAGGHGAGVAPTRIVVSQV